MIIMQEMELDKYINKLYNHPDKLVTFLCLLYTFKL